MRYNNFYNTLDFGLPGKMVGDYLYKTYLEVPLAGYEIAKVPFSRSDREVNFESTGTCTPHRNGV